MARRESRRGRPMQLTRSDAQATRARCTLVWSCSPRAAAARCFALSSRLRRMFRASGSFKSLCVSAGASGACPGSAAGSREPCCIVSLGSISPLHQPLRLRPTAALGLAADSLLARAVHYNRTRARVLRNSQFEPGATLKTSC